MSDTIIRVRRDVPLVLPESFERQETRYHRAHHVGPEAYNVRELEQCFHPAQYEGGTIVGHAVYTYLACHGLFSRCLSLHDLEAIQEKGVLFFRRHFGKPVLAWQTRALDGGRYPRVPGLLEGREKDGVLAIKWRHLNQYIGHNTPIWLLPAHCVKMAR